MSNPHDAPAPADHPRETDPKMTLTTGLRRILDRTYETPGPGAAIGIYRGGRMIASAVVGHADLEASVPIEPGTRFEIASVSKQIGAAAILTLARDGLVDLDADICTYVSHLQVQGITVRHCLQHTSGLPDYLMLAEIAGVPVGSVLGYDDFLAGVGRITDLDFQPGTSISYSNTGYVLAAIAAERASGQIWSNILDERVFAPLGMTNSLVRTHVGQHTPGTARSYAPSPSDGFLPEEMGEGRPPDGARHTVGDGQVLTSLDDFAAWHGFLLDGRTLGVDIRDQLFDCSVLSDGQATVYGMGIRREAVGGTQAYGHSGSIWGYRAHMLTDPTSGIGVAVFANRSDTDPEDLGWRAFHLAAGRDRVAGSWYSAGALRSADILTKPDGALEFDDGLETLVFEFAGSQTWVGRNTLERIEVDEDALIVTDGMGRRMHYRRAEPTEEPPAATVTGTFRSEYPPVDFAIRPGKDTLELARGTRPPLPLRYVTTDAGAHVYGFGAGLALIETGPPSRLTISTEAAVLKAIPRVEETEEGTLHA